jgi:hypothetical protein
MAPAGHVAAERQVGQRARAPNNLYSCCLLFLLSFLLAPVMAPAGHHGSVAFAFFVSPAFCLRQQPLRVTSCNPVPKLFVFVLNVCFAVTCGTIGGTITPHPKPSDRLSPCRLSTPRKICTPTCNRGKVLHSGNTVVTRRDAPAARAPRKASTHRRNSGPGTGGC